MRPVSSRTPPGPTKIGGQISTPADKSVRVTRINGARISFGELARFACPTKTDAWLSSVTGYDARTCRRWMADQNEPPAEALGVILGEIMRLYQRR